MAVTQGHGNPDWSRDETILALDLYFKCGGQVPGETDPRVVALSSKLRMLPIHAGAAKKDSFRNPAGVAFKLQNLRKVATGRGLGNVSAMDRLIWQDFGGAQEQIAELASQIGNAFATGVTPEQVAAVDADEEFIEGRILTAMHRARERNPKVRDKLLKARAAIGALTCDACGEPSKVKSPEMVSAGFEAHHTVPLASAGERTTKLADVALLCATCHRLIHQAMHIKRSWVSLPMFRELLQPLG